MNILKKYFTFFILLLVSFGYAQEPKNNTLKKDIPVSIYTATQISTDLNTILNLNKRLNLKSYQFLVLAEKNLEMGEFAVPLHNITLTPSNYIYESYQKIHEKRVLEAAFFNISDLYLPRSKNGL